MRSTRHTMIRLFTRRLLFPVFLLLHTIMVAAQDNRTQSPWFLTDLSVGVNIGYIHYPFSSSHLNRGYTAGSLEIPRTAVRITLLDRPIVKDLSVRVTYMRPVNWPYYYDINGDKKKHSVYMNFGGITFKSAIPVNKKISIHGEAGLGVVTRKGFQVDGANVLDDLVYATLLSGAGITYQRNKKWSFNASVTYAPGNKKNNHPSTLFYSGGFLYTMRKLSPEKAEAAAKAGYVFPKHLIQVGYATNGVGRGVNRFLANGAVPVFWGGAKWLDGLMLQYQRNIFHTRKVFSMDVGFSAGFWKSSEQKQGILTLAVFPAFRFTLLRTKPADFYFYYGVPGPCFISRTEVDGIKAGSHFTFQDLMGIGSFIGKGRRWNVETRIGHYSNGNIFPDNPGLGVPLTFCAGYTF